jgi:hypothetical protein
MNFKVVTTANTPDDFSNVSVDFVVANRKSGDVHISRFGSGDNRRYNYRFDDM